MTHTHSLRFARISTMALLAVGALSGAACRSTEPVVAAAAASAAPLAVNCGPGLQALIRPGLVAGHAVSQVDCVPVAGMPVPALATLDGDPRLMPVAYTSAAQPVRYRPVHYASTPVRRVSRGRTVKKSALIIGSSAGIGAGIGAAVKGKKGALIGGAIGGGAATIWDQITRHDR